MGIQKCTGAQRPLRIRGRQVKFPTTIEADPVRAVLNGEHTAHVFVRQRNKNWKIPSTQLIKRQSCARCRRSQLPFVSSHASSERTLARARAIAQSAAP